MFFSNTHWPQLTTPFYSILFETFICQFNSSNFSPIMPDEVNEHLTRSETIPSSRITPGPSDSQLHSQLLFSSPHLFSTGFGSEDWDGQQKLGFVLSDPLLCCFWGLCLDYCTAVRSKHGPNIIRFITESVTYWFFICWYLIESMMPCV